MLARNYMYVRLRVHAVQWALLLRLEVDNTSSLALIQTWRVRPLISSYQVCSCSNFGLTMLSDELKAGHSNIYEVWCVGRSFQKPIFTVQSIEPTSRPSFKISSGPLNRSNSQHGTANYEVICTLSGDLSRRIVSVVCLPLEGAYARAFHHM